MLARASAVIGVRGSLPQLVALLIIYAFQLASLLALPAVVSLLIGMARQQRATREMLVLLFNSQEQKQPTDEVEADGDSSQPS